MSLGLENKENGTREATATAAPWSFQSKRGCSTSCSGTLPELGLPAWVFSSAPQGTDRKHQGANCTPAGEPQAHRPKMELPRLQSFPAPAPGPGSWSASGMALPRHCRGFASTCSWERRQISFHEHFEFKYNLTKHYRGQATLLALPSTLSEAPKPAQPMPTASDDCSSLLSEARKPLFFLRRA